MQDDIVYCSCREHKIRDKMPIGFWVYRLLKQLPGLPQVAGAWESWNEHCTALTHPHFCCFQLWIWRLFPSGAEHSKSLRSTCFHIYVVCDIGLVFLVPLQRITKDLREGVHRFEQEFLKASSVTREQTSYLEMRLHHGVNPASKHFENFIMPCKLLNLVSTFI